MITITIDNPELEKVFHENFASDNDCFVDYISHNCHANNLAYSRKFSAEEIARYEAAYNEGKASGDSGLTHEEVWEQLFQKYDSN